MQNTQCEEIKIFENPTSSLFTDLVIEVVSIGNKPFKWHSIKGVSNDDFHTHLDNGIHNLFHMNASDESAEPYLKYSLLRDILSSCPSPIYSINKNVCAMRFSTLEKSCVTVESSCTLTIVVEAREQYNYNYLILLTIGIAIILLHHRLAESKMFQVIYVFSVACMYITLIA